MYTKIVCRYEKNKGIFQSILLLHLLRDISNKKQKSDTYLIKRFASVKESIPYIFSKWLDREKR